jgi:hypothetical protein
MKSIVGDIVEKALAAEQDLIKQRKQEQYLSNANLASSDIEVALLFHIKFYYSFLELALKVEKIVNKGSEETKIEWDSTLHGLNQMILLVPDPYQCVSFLTELTQLITQASTAHLPPPPISVVKYPGISQQSLANSFPELSQLCSLDASSYMKKILSTLLLQIANKVPVMIQRERELLGVADSPFFSKTPSQLEKEWQIENNIDINQRSLLTIRRKKKIESDKLNTMKVEIERDVVEFKNQLTNKNYYSKIHSAVYTLVEEMIWRAKYISVLVPKLKPPSLQSLKSLESFGNSEGLLNGMSNTSPNREEEEKKRAASRIGIRKPVPPPSGTAPTKGKPPVTVTPSPSTFNSK